jgi:uncharacterized repeat protein (TIGR03803 family)
MVRSATGALCLISLLAGPAAAQTYELVHRFRSAGASEGRLFHASDGFFYGTTRLGGTSGVGTIFKMDQSGTFTTLHSFGFADGSFPDAGLLQATDGNLYGVSAQGGASNLGVVFRLDANGVLTVLHHFDGTDGADPEDSLIQTEDGTFYGTTCAGGAAGKGTIFKMDSAGNLTVLHTFTGGDGSCPFASLLAYGTYIYGTTRDGGSNDTGTIFRIGSSGALTTVHSFGGAEGRFPLAPLVHATDGFFYGTTRFGAANENGTIFRMSSSGVVSLVHVFSVDEGERSSGGVIQASDGYLYGTLELDKWNGWAWTGNGAIFRVDLSGTFELVHSFVGTDGRDPYPGLIEVNGELYGLTTGGGASQVGTVFKADFSGPVTSLHSFEYEDGVNPIAGLIQGPDAAFYGTCWKGGTHNLGTVFEIDTTAAATTIHDFAIDESAHPSAPLVLASDGYLYGTTEGGPAGENPFGTAFRLDPSGADFSTVHVFIGGNNIFPKALIQGTDGNLYGATMGDAHNPGGTVFLMDLSGDLTPLHIFDGLDGNNPSALFEASDGNFYGTTFGDTVFRVDAQGEFDTVHTFNGNDGYGPDAGVIQANDGRFYGTTTAGGTGTCANGCGTVFRMDSSGSVAILHNFSGPDGAYPDAPLIQAADGLIYGTTYSGGDANLGTVFQMDLSGDVVTLHSFNGTDGSHPQSALAQASDGSFLGTTVSGGLEAIGGGYLRASPPLDGSSGVVFRVILGPGSLDVASVAPSSGSASGGGSLDLLGAGFLGGATLTVGGATASWALVVDPTFLYGAAPPLPPGSLNDVTVTNADSTSATLPGAYFADFVDVPQADIFHAYVEAIFRAGVTAGCGGGNYCRDAAALRKQMAVFVLKAKEGSSYTPPPAVGIFTDVPASDPFAPWIEELYNRGVVAGCGPGPTYCPDNPVLRQQMAVFLLKTLLGSAYVPPACVGIFADVPCSNPFAPWIEDLYDRQITGGCGNGNYCPANSATRGQMAVFLVKTFGLQ